MVHNPAVEHMRLILRIRNALINYVFGEKDVLLEKVIFKIAEENQKLLNAPTATFMYQKKWYPTHVRGASLQQKQQFNRALHLDCRTKIQKLMDVDFNNEMSQAGVENLFSQVLRMAKSKQDFKNLLPAELNRIVQNTLPDDTINTIWKDPIGLPETEIVQFKTEHVEDYKYLHKIIMTRLLLNQGL